ncbi:MAG: lysophospholipid acyltransferase family protein [Longimonas sp.]|uniref:lysophospholipid acyltransferase family protein n=1 Tax=Longimonas sp. TaxID=2039626 RepID=UPI003976D9F7
MTLYTILVRLLRVINRLYFVEVRSTGRAHVPDTGPVLLAANHPSSILDSVLMSTALPRPIHYLARSGLFRIPLVAWFFRQMGAIPIYRSAETRHASARNRTVFNRVYELFESGGCVGIFPEGQNSPTAQVAPLRTGAARMALEAEARNDYALGLSIIPVGINFESRELLTAAVLLHFGAPICVADYGALYRTDPRAAVQQLTADIQAALRTQAVHIEDRQAGQLAEDLSEILQTADTRKKQTPASSESLSYGQRALRWLMQWYWRTTPTDSAAFEQRMLHRARIYDVLRWAVSHAPDALRDLRTRVERYKDHASQTRLRYVLSHSFAEPHERLLRLRMTLYAVLMAPVVAFGFVHNAVPYLSTKLTARRFDNEAVRGFAYFVLGIALFGATYMLIGIGLWRYTDLHWLQRVAYVALLPPTGFAVLSYRRTLVLYRDRILVRTAFWKHEDLVTFLREERVAIAQRFRALHERFAEASSSAS